MKNLFLLLLFITFFSCNNHEKKDRNNFGKAIPFQQTNFSSTCDLLNKSDTIHGHRTINIDKTNSYIGIDSLNQILFNLKQYDINDGESFDNYLKECNGLKILTWNSNSNKLTTLEKLTFKTSIILDNGSANNILITDFNIYRTEKPKHIHLRVVNDCSFEKLRIDEITYNSFFEDRLIGLDKAIATIDSLEKSCEGNEPTKELKQ